MKTKLLIIFRSFSFFGLAILSTNLNATPQNQLDSYYNGMSNTTQPGSYTTQQRGVFFGGRYTEKQPIVSTNLVDIRLPSVTSGCGGIDAFGGSFSFINADQLIATMRAVASNAKGYAFSIALNEMCPDCMTQISKLQDSLQKMNAHMADSCQLAQGITLDVAGALGAKNLSAAQQQMISSDPIATEFSSIYKDAASVWEDTEGAAKKIFSRMDAANPQGAAALTKGAMLYRMMASKSGGIKPFVADADSETMEVLLSLFGSPLILTDGDDVKNDYLPPLMSTQVLIDAFIGNPDGTPTKLSIYDCSLTDPVDTNKTLCLIHPTDPKKDVNYVGLMPKFRNALINYRNQIATGVADTTTPQDKNAMVNIGHQYLARVATLSRCKGGATLAQGFIDDTLDSVVLDAVTSVFSRSITSMKHLTTLEKGNHEDQIDKTIKDVNDSWDKTISNMRSKIGSSNDIRYAFKDYMQKCDMTPVEAIPDSKKSSQ